MKKYLYIIAAIIVIILIIQACKKNKVADPAPINPSSDKSTKDWAVDPEFTGDTNTLTKEKSPIDSSNTLALGNGYQPGFTPIISNTVGKPIPSSDPIYAFTGRYEIEDDQGVYWIYIEPSSEYSQGVIRNFGRKYDLPIYASNYKGQKRINGYGVFNGIEVYMPNITQAVDYSLPLSWYENNVYKSSTARVGWEPL